MISLFPSFFFNSKKALKPSLARKFICKFKLFKIVRYQSCVNIRSVLPFGAFNTMKVFSYTVISPSSCPALHNTELYKIKLEWTVRCYLILSASTVPRQNQ